MACGAAVDLVVGLTGGIGSGKSAAAEEFGAARRRRWWIPMSSHTELTGKGGAAIPAIETLFGHDVLGPDGSMDRRRSPNLADPAASRSSKRCCTR